MSALQYKTSDLNQESEEQTAFSVTWERTGENVFKGGLELYIVQRSGTIYNGTSSTRRLCHHRLLRYRS